MTLAIVVVATALALVILLSLTGGGPGDRLGDGEEAAVLPESPERLALDDPVSALQRYGVAEDFDRLAGQGVDLRDLGYHPREAE